VELLLFWKAHYMDAWDAAKVASLDASMKDKYDRRYQKGDVVEVREDGYWDKRGFDKEAFCVVKVPGEAADYDKMAALWDRDPAEDTQSVKAKVVKRRKWNVDSKKLDTADKDSLDGASKTVSVTKTKADAFLTEKTSKAVKP